ncbi:MAG: N-acetylglucosaminyldiphosphoundecaprenol N-acetyl-beta-D-mannosaminyltransferase [Cyanobacteriota bacterium]|jgi:N-acetylglucosaminyldiphosphoundecaprenol N-acetyl-beta-D-mannosaminyltransferase
MVLANRSDAIKTLKVMGLPVHVGTNYADWLLAQYRAGRGSHVVTLNAEMAMQADRNPTLRQIITGADLIIPDGAGVVLYFRVKGKRIERTPGIELAAQVLQRLDPQETAFFYGGAPGITDHAALYWQRHAPALQIVGTQHGFLSPEDQAAFLQRLETLQPSVIFVGLGVPRQEMWIRDHRHLCPNSIWIGVGGSFDIWAGVKTRAPEWMCRHNLEWLYRLYQEPWRWRRMLALPKFAWRSLTYASR